MAFFKAFCPHCRTRQDQDKAQWSAGPEHIRFDYSCHGCGWQVQIQARTMAFIIRQMDFAMATAQSADRSES